MKNIIFNKFLLLAITLFIVSNCGISRVNYNYEHRCIGTARQGVQLVEVFSYGKTVGKAIEASKRNAVHAVLFKGLQCSDGHQPPIARDSDAEKHKAYFEEFFSSGKYLQYVTLSGDGTIDPSDRIKTDVGYKVGIDVAVNYDALRKKLESDGIVRSLNHGF